MAAEPQHLSEAISQLISLRGLARRRGQEQLESVWSAVAGPRLGERTRVQSFNRGVLNVSVTNAATLSELVSFHRDSLLRRLQDEHPELKIRDLKFRLKGKLND